MPQTSYYVVERARGWVVCIGGYDPHQACETLCSSKLEATNSAKVLAGITRPSVVRVLAKDGSFEDEWTFEAGAPSDRLLAVQRSSA